MATSLLRLTTQYVEDEDRIRLMGETQDLKTITLWLTRRMLDQLVLRMVAWLQGQDDSLQAEVMQTFAQEAARQALSPQPAVTQEQVVAEGLVKSIDITTASDRIEIKFKNIEIEPVLVMQAQPLRQWLSILRAQYQLAQWPSEVWPDWLSASGMQPSSSAIWH